MSEDSDKKLNEIHLAVCGDPTLGVNGLVRDMADVRKRIEPLEKAKQDTMTLGRASRLIGGFVVGIFAIAAAIVTVLEFIKKFKSL